MPEENKTEKMEMIFTANGKEVKLSPSIVQQFITKGNANITQQEAINFMQLCKYSSLNPFLNEAYLIKYSNDRPADMIVSKEAIMKRANRQPDYNGFEAGVIVEKDNEIIYRTGQFVAKKDILVGGWAKVYRKGIEHAFEIEVSLAEYSTGKSTWNKMPGNMIRKVALVSALREAYPEQLGAMYSEEEPSRADFEDAAQDEPVKDEKNDQLLNEFKKTVEKEPEPPKEKAIKRKKVDPIQKDQTILDEKEIENIDATIKGGEAFEQTGFFKEHTITLK